VVRHRRIDTGERGPLLLGGQSAVEFVPVGEAFGRWGYDVAEYLAPEASDPLGYSAVKRDLKLPDRRHRSTVARRAELDHVAGSAHLP
jgi:hypothetical protein